MIFIFASTTILFFTVLLVSIVATVFAVVLDIQWITFLSFAIDVASIFAIIYMSRFALKKYTKMLDKMNYDIHEYLNDQYKILRRPLISKSVEILVKSNIAAGYINNEQYGEALNIYSDMEATGYQGLTSPMRFVVLTNQMSAYVRLGDFERARMYLQNAEIILRNIQPPQGRFQSTIYKFNIKLQVDIAEFNFIVNRNEQTALELLNRVQEYLNSRAGDINVSNVILHYILGVACVVLGDTVRANIEFDNVLNSGSTLPCTARIKKYRETGDESILNI